MLDLLDLPFDLDDPPADPPGDATQPLLWTVSRVLFIDHDPPAGQGATCTVCGEPWPCRSRRMAEYGLLSAISGANRSARR
jgi:hypothetical protein